MRLISLDVAGFKSFAHKTNFHFSEGTTALIGPNGSGKSNIADAVAWVLGEQSLKAVRGRKTDDVIFGGNAIHKRSGRATVALTLSNESGRLPVEAAEVTITRTIDRSGEGTYLINDDPVRLLDVRQILAEAGIGTKSYTVISQGTVDRYITATPAVRRELFDEATGIKALQLKLDRAQRKIEQAYQHIHELTVILRELEPRLRVLQRQATRQAQRQQLEGTYQSTQASWYRQAWHERRQAVEITNGYFRAAQERLQTATANRVRVEEQLLRAAAQHTIDPAAHTQVTPLEHLHHAETEYAAALARYQEQEHERLQLTESLQTVHTSLRQAEAALATARIANDRQDFFAELTSTLQTCRRILVEARAGRQLEESLLEQAEAAIQRSLAALAQEDTAVEAAQSLLAHLEGPLQAVARLQAIVEERTTRLRALPATVVPSDEQVVQWRRVVADQKSPVANANALALQSALAAVREEELAAERESAAATAASAQAQQALAELEREILRERGTPLLEEIQKSMPDEATEASEDEVRRLAAKLATLGEIDPLALQEYEEVAARHDHLQQQLADVNTTAQNTKHLIAGLQQDMRHRFQAGFAAIEQEFKKYFQQLFGGGSVALSIVPVGNEEPSAVVGQEGIDIVVHPPHKKPLHVQLLSGGEKTMTALALLLAILKVQHPPFIVLDEVDAALDEANSQRFGTVLHEISTTTQCVVITHNRETMSQAHVLYGITMGQEGTSAAYSVRMSDLHEMAGKELPV